MTDWPTLRAALARAVMRSSVRAVAREVEMVPAGLKKLLDGSTPQPKTQRRVTRWYVRNLTSSATSADELLAVEAILGDFTEPMKSEMREMILAKLEEIRGRVER